MTKPALIKLQRTDKTVEVAVAGQKRSKSLAVRTSKTWKLACL